MRHWTVLRGSLEPAHLARQAKPAWEKKRAGRDGLHQRPLQMDVYTLEFDGEFFVFDVQSCTLIAADRIARDILKLSATNTERQILDTLGNRYRKVEVIEGFQELELLIKSGFLHRCEDAPRHYLPDFDEILGLPTSLLSLGLTATCNMSCSYCFEKQDPRSVLKRMSPKVATQAFDWLLERSGSVESLYIRFFGGEPLLNFPSIESMASYAAAKAHDRNKDVAFLLNTNGTLLDERIVEFISKYRVGVCISMDGPDRLHNIHRRFKNGHDSFDKVALGVRKLLERGVGGVQAQAALTRQTCDGLQEMPHFFRDMGFDGVYVGFVDGSQDESYLLSEEYLKGLYGDYVNILESCMIEAQPCRFNLFGHDKILRRLYRGEPAYYGCPAHAGISMVHVDPAGDLYPCHRLLKQEDCLGNVARETPTMQADRIRKRFAGNNVYENECRKCWARHLCGGTCPAQSPPSTDGAGHCDLRERLALNLGLYIRLWRKHRPLLDALYRAA
jgi:uncharacterized protein